MWQLPVTHPASFFAGLRAEAVPSCCYLLLEVLASSEVFCPGLVDDSVSPSGSALNSAFPPATITLATPHLPLWVAKWPTCPLLPFLGHHIWITGDLWGHQAEAGEFRSNSKLWTHLWESSKEGRRKQVWDRKERNGKGNHTILRRNSCNQPHPSVLISDKLREILDSWSNGPVSI